MHLYNALCSELSSHTLYSDLPDLQFSKTLNTTFKTTKHDIKKKTKYDIQNTKIRDKQSFSLALILLSEKLYMKKKHFET